MQFDRESLAFESASEKSDLRIQGDTLGPSELKEKQQLSQFA